MIFDTYTKYSEESIKKKIFQYSEKNNIILRKRTRNTSSKTILSYICKSQKLKHCPYKLTFEKCILDDFFFFTNSHLIHSHDSNISLKFLMKEKIQKSVGRFYEKMKKITLKNPNITPSPVLQKLIRKNYLSDEDKIIFKSNKNKYKKSFDNMLQKIKYQIREESHSQESTIEESLEIKSFENNALEDYEVIQPMKIILEDMHPLQTNYSNKSQKRIIFPFIIY